MKALWNRFRTWIGQDSEPVVITRVVEYALFPQVGDGKIVRVPLQDYRLWDGEVDFMYADYPLPVGEIGCVGNSTSEERWTFDFETEREDELAFLSDPLNVGVPVPASLLLPTALCR